MIRDRVRKHAERVRQVLQDHPGTAKIEQDTKAFLIGPLLECLGYQLSNPAHIRFEVSTDFGTKKVDYMLNSKNGTNIAVEAKSANTVLSKMHIQQLRDYFTYSKAAAGILTNGLQFWLFTDLDKTSVMDLEPYHIVNLGDPDQLTNNDLHHLEILARNEVGRDAIREAAKQQRLRKQVRQVIEEEFRSPSVDFVKMVGRRLEIKPLNQARIKELAPLVADAVRSHVFSTDPPPELLPEAHPVTDRPGGLTAGKKAAKTKADFRGATLFGKDLETKNYTQMLVLVVHEMQARHPYDFAETVRNGDLFKGKTWWKISQSPENLSPKRTKRQVGDYWVDTHLSAKNKIKRCGEFLSAFGYDPDQVLQVHTADD